MFQIFGNLDLTKSAFSAFSRLSALFTELDF